MVQCGLLLCPEHEAPTPGGAPLARGRRRETMPRPVSKPIGGTFKPLLGLDHVARSEPILAAPVLPQCDQLGAGAYRPHHLVELVFAVAVPERELRQVAPRERGLLARDRVERDLRPGDDLLAILARNPGMVLNPLGILAPTEPARSCRPDLVLRLKVDALRLQRAMIDMCIDIQFGQTRVDMIGPRDPPFLQQRVAVPVAHLLPEPLRANLAHRQHDMRVRLGFAVLAPVPMHIEVRDHAAFDELLLDEIAGELHALRLVHFARNRELDLTGKLRVLALFPCLHLVPQGRTIV